MSLLSRPLSAALRIYLWAETWFLHPELRTDERRLRETRSLVFMMTIIGGVRILMLIYMWVITGDERYWENAIQLHLLSLTGIILPFTPSYRSAALALLTVGHLRYAYAICVVETPLLSELCATLCIPIISYYLAGFGWALASSIFCSLTWIYFLWNGGEFSIEGSFEPVWFHALSVVWAILGAASIAVVQGLSQQHYLRRLNERIEKQVALVSQLEENDTMLKQFLAVLSHEVRNPLSVMLGRASLMELTSYRSSKVKQTIQYIEQRMALLNTLMMQVKEQKSSVTGLRSLDSEPRTVEQVLATLQQLLSLHSSENIEIQVITKSDARRIREPIHLEHDLLRLSCILLSLADAGDFKLWSSPEHPEICLQIDSMEAFDSFRVNSLLNPEDVLSAKVKCTLQETNRYQISVSFAAQLVEMEDSSPW